MNDREAIFKRIRDAIAPIPSKNPYPEYDTAQAVMRSPTEYSSLWEQFAWRMKSVNAIPLRGWDELGGFLKEYDLHFGYCDSEYVESVAAISNGITLAERFNRDELDRYEFGITPAFGAIAETGTIVLNDQTTRKRLAALAPWIHIAILHEDQIWPDTPTAISHLGSDPSVVWITGPSKTADVEGILIEGVHGPGIQACCLV